MSSLDLPDVIANLLAAASRTTEPGARAVYLAEARIRVDAAKAKANRLDELTSAAEAEMVRLERGARESV